MRVAIVTTSYPAFAGDACGHFVQSEVRRRAAIDEVVVVTARHEHDAGPPSIDEEPWSVLRLAGGDAFGWPGLGARIRARPHRLAFAAAWAWRARQTLVTLAPFDRIVAHWAVPCGWPLSTSLRVPVELVSHGADVRTLVSCPRALRRVIVWRLLRDADTWRFVSSALLDRLLASLDPPDARRLSRIAHVEKAPIDMPDVRLAAAETRAVHAGVRLVVCVARLVPAKRVDRVIDHAATLRAPLRLVVVGDGPARASLERRARSLGMDALFVGLTTRPVALAWIGAADLVLHASEAEGLSTVEREASALGVPFCFVGADGGVCMSRDLR